MAIELLRRRFTVEEYHRMALASILGRDDRVELIEGEIVTMTPSGVRHAACVRRLNRLLSARIGDRAIVDVQNPIRLSEHSEPQPDVALLRPRPDDYAHAHPGPEDVLLVVEVAETSAESDGAVTLPLYARAGIAEVWLVDLTAETVEVHRGPPPQGYEAVQRVGPKQTVCPRTVPDLRLATDDLLK
ncbi:MAG: Uma2 family endonuclease [candidate division NC10 bacterium]